MGMTARIAAAGVALVGGLSLSLGMASADEGQPAPSQVQPEHMSATPHVRSLDEARKRWNPQSDPSTVITDNGDSTYGVVRTDR